MRSSLAFRLAFAFAVIAALAGFRFLRHHITNAPVIDHAAPFYGTGLVIGPEVELPGLAKRVPVKLRLYKWLKRKGDTQYVPGLRREGDCSLSEVYVDLADYTVARTLPAFEDRLRAAAGLAGPGGPFTHGCTDPTEGIPGRNLAGGHLPAGTLYGAGPDFHADGSIALYRSDGTTLTDHHDVVIVPENTNQYVGYLGVADFNRDGKPDYVVALSAYGDDAVARIAILLGDGVGGYAAPVFYTIAAAPAGSGKSASTRGFTIEDFNADDKLDLAVSYDIGGNAHGLVSLRGHGNGAFDNAIPAASDVGYDVLSADFNGDGKPDLATGDGFILFGDGNGGFDVAPERRFDQGGIVAGDFNNDGKTDLVVVALTGDGSPVHVWLGGGDGTFSRVGPGYATGYGTGSADFAVTDLDGDGNLDLVVGSSSEGLYGASINSQGQSQFLLGRGDGTFASPPIYDNAAAAIADYDRDGKLDLLALDLSSATHGVRPLLGDGAGGFHAGAFSPLGFDFYDGLLQSWSAPDLDGDGKADLVTTQSTFDQPPTATLHTRLGNGDGTFHSSGTDLALGFGLGSFGYVNGALPATGDFNGDGKTDLAMIGYGAADSALYLFAGNGDGSVVAPAAIDTGLAGAGDPSGAVLAADFNADGKPDLVLIDAGRRYDSTPVPGSVRVYRNLGGGAFAPALVLGGAAYPEGLAIGDVNGDGRLDIVVASEISAFANDTLYVWLGNGDATFQTARTQELPDFWFQSVALGDADGDGKADIVLGNCCGLTFAYYARGDGAGGFALPAIMPLTVSPQLLLLADLTGSGRPALVVESGYSNDPSVRVFLNTFRDAIFASGFDAS